MSTRYRLQKGRYFRDSTNLLVTEATRWLQEGLLESLLRK